MIEPPGIRLPFAGQGLPIASVAYLRAINTLKGCKTRLGNVVSYVTYLRALMRITSMYSSCPMSVIFRIAPRSSSIGCPTFPVGRGCKIPAFAKKKSRCPSSEITRSTKSDMALGSAASALRVVTLTVGYACCKDCCKADRWVSA